MADSTEEIAALEGRLAQALARIQSGLARWPVAVAPEALAEAGATDADEVAPQETGADAGVVAALRAELEEEQTANAQLQQRVHQIRRRQEEKVTGLEEALAASEARVEALQEQTAGLHRTSEDLRQALEQMQSAVNGAGIDAHLINRTMMAELEALRAERASEAQELGALLSALGPMMDAGERADA